MNKPHIIQLEKIGSPSLGYITVAEYQKNIPFEIKRVYWTYFTPNDVLRGGHAHRKLNHSESNFNINIEELDTILKTYGK